MGQLVGNCHWRQGFLEVQQETGAKSVSDRTGDAVGLRIGRWRPRWIHLLYACIAVSVTAVLAFSFFQPIKVLPRIHLAPGFSLVNQAGERRTSEDYRGRVAIYGFTYSRCGAHGRESMARMHDLRENLLASAPEGLSFALVAITVDPDYDTTAVLAEYAALFQAAQDNGVEVSWDFLRGDQKRTKYVVGGGFGIYFAHEPGHNTRAGEARITLEPRWILVDGWGIVRAEYREDTLDVDRVMGDLEWLAAETRNSQGVASLAYEAAHLFRCYP